jgi:hypothetical protein
MIPIKDPRLILQADMPLLIDCNQTDAVGDAIDFRTDIKGIHPFAHSMLMIDAGQVVSQSPAGYQEFKIDLYMTANTYMAFTELVNSNPAFVAAFRKSVLDKLNGPAWRKAYNWIQIFGQIIGLPLLSWPGLDDCTMDVIYHLKAASYCLPRTDYQVIQGIPNNCNPEQFADIKINNPTVFNVVYTYDSSAGVIA